MEIAPGCVEAWRMGKPEEDKNKNKEENKRELQKKRVPVVFLLLFFPSVFVSVCRAVRGVHAVTQE